MVRPLNFMLAYAVDSFSMAGKIMGRQSAGVGLLKALVDTWPTAELHALAVFASESEQFRSQLQGLNFRGRMHWHRAYPQGLGDEVGAIYWPAPVPERLAHLRNAKGPASRSLFGVTHTLASKDAMDTVARYAAAPFQPWDALICTSAVARDVAERLQGDYREWAASQLGATRFNTPRLPVIPLGADVDALERTPTSIGLARGELGLAPDEVVFLFAGRLVFHAKANPGPFYQALEAAAARTGRKLVCIEAGVFPNAVIREIYLAAQKALAPSVRFLHVEGTDEPAYRNAWQAADVFTSLADNVQETFGLTPVEAMAAGLPALVSDWNGYRDTVRDGVDGFRIPTVMPGPGAGADLAYRYAVDADTYDQYVGRLSFATAIDPAQLTDRIAALAEDEGLRARMGRAGRARAVADYRWATIVQRYADLVAELDEIRRAVGPVAPVGVLNRPDPFTLFQSYPTRLLAPEWGVAAAAGSTAALETLLQLGVANALADGFMPRETIQALHRLALQGGHTGGTLLAAVDGGDTPAARRALMWLAKFGLVVLTPA